jgi:voltage-gated potassium channel
VGTAIQRLDLFSSSKDKLMPSIKKIIEESDSLAGKTFDLFIQSLIILSLISFSIETLPDLSENSRSLLRGIEISCVALFTVEYIARIIVASRKLKFVFSFFGLIDLFAILPFYLSTGLDLRTLRSFRLLRLMRILKLTRYSRAANRIKKAFKIAKDELVISLFAALILLYLASVGIYYFEYTAQPDKFSSIFHSLWWAVSTLTTVGYGDVYPITVGGKVFTVFILIIGLGMVSVPAGLIASALVKVRDNNE